MADPVAARLDASPPLAHRLSERTGAGTGVRGYGAGPAGEAAKADLAQLASGDAEAMESASSSDSASPRAGGGGGGGRPPLPPELRRRHRVFLTLSDRARRRVFAQAEAAGERPTSWAAQDLVARLRRHTLLPSLGEAELEGLRASTDALNALVRRLHVERHQAPALRMAGHTSDVRRALADLRASMRQSLHALDTKVVEPAGSDA